MNSVSFNHRVGRSSLSRSATVGHSSHFASWSQTGRVPISKMLYVPYAKALILDALAAWLVTSVITAGSMHEGVTLNAAPSPVLVKRYLRSNVDMTTSGRTGSSEERASLLGLTNRLETSLSKIVRGFQL